MVQEAHAAQGALEKRHVFVRAWQVLTYPLFGGHIFILLLSATSGSRMCIQV